MGEFTTARGVKVGFVGIAALLDKLNGQFHLPEPPSYEVKLATGGTERHVHDETTVQTDEEKQALIQYKVDCARIRREHERKLTRLVLLRGITFEYPNEDAWVREQEFLGIDVPTDPMERRLHYIETEVIATVDDVESIMLGVMVASGVPEDLLKQVEASFRHPIRSNGRDEAKRVDTPSNGSGVVLHEPIRAGAVRGPKSPHSKRIRRTG